MWTQINKSVSIGRGSAVVRAMNESITALSTLWNLSGVMRVRVNVLLAACSTPKMAQDE